MKILLLHGIRPFSLELKMKYLKDKGIPFWIYQYESKNDRYVRIPFKERRKARIEEWDTFISTVDHGEIIPDVYGSPESHEGYFHKHRNEIRQDKVLIDIISRERDLFFYNAEIIDIPKGKRGRILMDWTTHMESLELEDDIDWITADC